MSKIYVDEIAGIASPSTVAIPGHVIQVVSEIYTTQTAFSTDNTTWVNYLEASITPSSTTSKIVYSVGIPYYLDGTQSAMFSVFRGGTNLHNGNGFGYDQFDVSNTHRSYVSGTFLDEPSTTSSTTYSVRAKGSGGGSVVCPASTTMSITLMEIAG